jgi:hypothetical protein
METVHSNRLPQGVTITYTANPPPTQIGLYAWKYMRTIVFELKKFNHTRSAEHTVIAYEKYNYYLKS